MVMETETFIIKRIEWRLQKSNEGTTNRIATPYNAGIKWMEVKCKNCQHEWKAKDSYEIGCIYEIANQVIFDCPRCSKSHRIRREQLD